MAKTKNIDYIDEIMEPKPLFDIELLDNLTASNKSAVEERLKKYLSILNSNIKSVRISVVAFQATLAAHEKAKETFKATVKACLTEDDVDRLLKTKGY